MSKRAERITAIGGLGGSGTRVFAAMLRHARVYIGDDLNGPLDNLWFTLLFKRPVWTQAQPQTPDIVTAIRLFRQAMTLGLSGMLSAKDRALIEGLKQDLLPLGEWNSGARAPQAVHLMQSGPSAAVNGGPWGWKEPNTHVFLPYLNRLLPDFRYIHIVRDGLDMAFSDNIWQMQHWAHMFDLDPDPSIPIPVRQLRYWLAANKTALEYGRTHMPGRFMAIRYEDFCSNPEPYWHAIRALAGAQAERTELPPDLIQPTTIGRARAHDLSIFPADLLESAQALHLDFEKPSVLG